MEYGPVCNDATTPRLHAVIGSLIRNIYNWASVCAQQTHFVEWPLKCVDGLMELQMREESAFLKSANWKIASLSGLGLSKTKASPN